MRHGTKIAFAGAGGTGKTTTQNAVAATLKLPVIPSASRTIYVEQNLTEDKVLAMPLEDRWKLQHDIFSKKIKLDDTTPEFISDRTLLDHWAYCLMYCAEAMTPEEYMESEALVRKHMLGAYTHVFYFPWGHWTSPSDGVRQDNPAWQSAIDAIILGYIYKWGLSVFTVPQTLGKDARAEYVVNKSPSKYYYY